MVRTSRLVASPQANGIPLTWVLLSRSTVCGFGTSVLSFTLFFEYCLTNEGSATVEPNWQDAMSASAMTIWFKGNVLRSLFCCPVRYVLSNNFDGTNSFASRKEVADVDGVNCWGSAKMRKTLICDGSCFRGARNVCIEFLFRDGVVVAVQLTNLDSTTIGVWPL